MCEVLQARGERKLAHETTCIAVRTALERNGPGIYLLFPRNNRDTKKPETDKIAKSDQSNPNPPALLHK